ncbi:MAG: RNA polymerase sigma factor [Spirochaetes bacterium]|nr:RNA polymerase sigma factor [Spirochaetota bacterium]
MPDDIKNLSDEEIARRFREGEGRLFDELYRRYKEKLRHVIYYYVGDSDEAQDIFHDVFVRVYKHIKTYRDDKPFSSWIYQIAVNCAKNFRNKSTKKELIFERGKEQLQNNFREGKFALSAEDVYMRKDDEAQFHEAVQRLRTKFRVVFLMRYDQQLKYSEIAEILGCSERTVKWRMKRAIELIVNDLKQKGIL